VPRKKRWGRKGVVKGIRAFRVETMPDGFCARHSFYFLLCFALVVLATMAFASVVFVLYTNLFSHLHAARRRRRRSGGAASAPSRRGRRQGPLLQRPLPGPLPQPLPLARPDDSRIMRLQPAEVRKVEVERGGEPARSRAGAAAGAVPRGQFGQLFFDSVFLGVLQMNDLSVCRSVEEPPKSPPRSSSAAGPAPEIAQASPRSAAAVAPHPPPPPPAPMPAPCLAAAGRLLGRRGGSLGFVDDGIKERSHEEGGMP
jgi:hypothetical protein